MHIAYTQEQEALRAELRDYYSELLTPEIRHALQAGRGVGETHRAVVRQMGADGWLGIGWPKEFGGQGRSDIEQFIFFDESMRAGAPVPTLTINTVGPTLYRNGSTEQKAFFLPKILKGEIHFCIGYTEPNAGTDLAALTTRAERDGDEYVINGQKVFTSLASDSDYIWLAARTDPEATKHAGISMFLVDMKSPGVKAEPMSLLSDHNICSTYFDNVRVPASRLVGGENKGWKLITSQLNHERVTICSPNARKRLRPGPRVDPGDPRQRRPTRHRPRVGPGQPGPGARGIALSALAQLEGRLGQYPGKPRRGRRFEHQGLWD